MSGFRGLFLGGAPQDPVRAGKNSCARARAPHAFTEQL